MKCKNCTSEKNCNSCFSKLIEKRVRKYIRINGLIKKNDKIVVCGPLSYFFIKKILEYLPLTIVKVDIISDFGKYKGYKQIRDYSLDDYNNDFLKKIYGHEEGNEIKSVLKLITDFECEKYSKINNIIFIKNEKDAAFDGFISNLSKDYPEIRYSLAKSTDQLKKYI